jgi:DNA-binding response OmpR family regulator
MRVLVVDDERSIADTLVTILRNAGHDARAAYDGTSALQHCDLLPPDFVISDVFMPGLDGRELALKILERCSGCKVCLLSAQSLPDDGSTEQLTKMGCDFVQKPVHPDVLLAKLV